MKRWKVKATQSFEILLYPRRFIVRVYASYGTQIQPLMRKRCVAHHFLGRSIVKVTRVVWMGQTVGYYFQVKRSKVMVSWVVWSFVVPDVGLRRVPQLLYLQIYFLQLRTFLIRVMNYNLFQIPSKLGRITSKRFPYCQYRCDITQTMRMSILPHAL